MTDFENNSYLVPIPKYAVWAITPKGKILAGKIRQRLDSADCHIPLHLKGHDDHCVGFENFKAHVLSSFCHYKGHIFIMATGIVIRIITPLIKDKTVDPAVVVLDEKCNHCISLLSGHLGGANELARQVAQIVGAVPVITTATDANDVPSIELIAEELDLVIENPAAIKFINMGFLRKETIEVLDPFRFLRDSLPAAMFTRYFRTIHSHPAPSPTGERGDAQPLIYVGDEIKELPPACLVLRPRILVAGIGCNRGTGKEEINGFLYEVLHKHKLSVMSLCRLATIDIKKDEKALVLLAKELHLPIIFYSSEELNRVKGLQSPSRLVRKHTGVESVCEAAALLGAKTTQLLVAKQVAKNVTVAVARTVCM
ncbi:MAG: hypothetical protein BA861_00805 [Desulfobacterales bacterium S3730MH5]|nr:MAG: hypothetical protein BA861_00805 [Desulfobacterales bacterium S3730MH5]